MEDIIAYICLGIVVLPSVLWWFDKLNKCTCYIDKKINGTTNEGEGINFQRCKNNTFDKL